MIVSISDEKPLHMRPHNEDLWCEDWNMFQSQMRSRSTCDLRRHHALEVLYLQFQSQMRSRSTCDSGAKGKCISSYSSFQSQMRSRSTCDKYHSPAKVACGVFQSQMRSRSTCDFVRTLCTSSRGVVSISDEKPLHMRQRS